MLTDIEISNLAQLKPIDKIAKKIGLNKNDFALYGKHKAKILPNFIKSLPNQKKAKLILVTALTPTPAGEGKSTVSIGLADGLNRLKKKVILSLREPSLGPCFGLKGGATGGGYAQVVPMDEINLNFTGDIHAITTANNLLAAMIDNHIKNNNPLKIKKVFFKRAIDLNDRALRHIKTALAPLDGISREDGFNISVASEVMAIFCLSKDLADLKHRLGEIIIGTDIDNNPIKAKDIKAEGAMAAILKDAINPNLVQTLEHTPALVHGGPFANIAHGTSSIIALNTALAISDYVVTESGFGADLGAEKFFDIVARKNNTYPDSVVIVATSRALKMHGGLKKEELKEENLAAIKQGFENLKAHINIIKKFGITPIVAINSFITDTKKELNLIKKLCESEQIKAVPTTCWANGSKGSIELAKAVIDTLNKEATPHTLYKTNLSLKEKIEKIAKEIYQAKDVEFAPTVLDDLALFEKWGYGNFPICIAKTQNSISHDKKLINAPSGYTFPVTEVRLSSGAGFVVALSGAINTMPGLPITPAAENVDVDENGNITGLF